MTNECPVHTSILKLLRTDLTSVCAVTLVIDVLRGDSNVFSSDFYGKEKVECRG